MYSSSDFSEEERADSEASQYIGERYEPMARSISKDGERSKKGKSHAEEGGGKGRTWSTNPLR